MPAREVVLATVTLFEWTLREERLQRIITPKTGTGE
jgi:hypothetical protein